MLSLSLSLSENFGLNPKFLLSEKKLSKSFSPKEWSKYIFKPKFNSVLNTDFSRL